MVTSANTQMVQKVKEPKT